jgi:single-stranded DNA-binding protein
MNLCSFTGYIVEDPKMVKDNGVSFTSFVVVTYTYRTAKSTGEKSRIPTFIKCEAWHTGAETICKLSARGTKIHIHASAKHPAKGSREIIFRVNEFDLDSSPTHNETE